MVALKIPDDTTTMNDAAAMILVTGGAGGSVLLFLWAVNRSKHLSGPRERRSLVRIILVGAALLVGIVTIGIALASGTG